LSGVDAAKWYPTLSNSSATADGGLVVTLARNGSGSSFNLISLLEYTSGNLTIEYDILSEYLTNNPTDELVYIGLQMLFVTGETLTIKRKVDSLNGHTIQAIHLAADGSFAGGGIIRDASASGKLRLIRHGQYVSAICSETMSLININIKTLADFNVQLFSTTNGQSEHCKVRYRNFKSNTGIMFGTSIMLNTTSASLSRIYGIVPSNSTIGLVDVLAFNHIGQFAQTIDAFEYPLILGQALSSNDGLRANVQQDVSIR